jgi:hypothetical protein
MIELVLRKCLRSKRWLIQDKAFGDVFLIDSEERTPLIPVHCLEFVAEELVVD